MSTREVQFSISAIYASEIYTSIMIEGVYRNSQAQNLLGGSIPLCLVSAGN